MAKRSKKDAIKLFFCGIMSGMVRLDPVANAWEIHNNKQGDPTSWAPDGTLLIWYPYAGDVIPEIMAGNIL